MWCQCSTGNILRWRVSRSTVGIRKAVFNYPPMLLAMASMVGAFAEVRLAPWTVVRWGLQEVTWMEAFPNGLPVVVDTKVPKGVFRVVRRQFGDGGGLA